MNKESIKRKVKKLMSQMTLDEKIEMLEGLDFGHMQGVERLGIPDFRLSDGPLGAQGATAFPSATAIASSFDRKLSYDFGKALGNDSRAKGYHCILGPGMNIIRTPLAGRSSEYYSEDPYLTAEMAVSTIKGVQSKGVWACAKHFVANSMENYRTATMSLVDERTLREIYMPAFEASVKRAKVATVMTAYNAVNGENCSRNEYIMKNVLKKEWGFDGFVMSNWGAGQGDPAWTLMHGLDVAMPVGEMGRPDVVRKAIEEGKVTVERVNEAVCRILTKAAEYGFLDNADIKAGYTVGGKFVDKMCYEIGAKGTVMLKNNGILPIKGKKKIAVMGPNAYPTESVILGSSHVDCNQISFYDAIKNAAENCEVTLVDDLVETAYETTEFYYDDNGTKVQGLKASYYRTAEFDKAPDVVRTDRYLNCGHAWRKIDWLKQRQPVQRLGVIWEGIFAPEKTDVYTVMKRSNGGMRVWIDGELVLDDTVDNEERPYMLDLVRSCERKLEKGKEYAVKVEYKNCMAPHCITAAVAIFVPDFKKFEKEAAKYDCVVYCAGCQMVEEGEGVERHFKLPIYQDETIAAVCKGNKNTIVLHNGCGAFDMDMWHDDVAAILQCWYCGQMGTVPVADILMGKVNPSGKLPVTFDKKLEDSPSYSSFYPDLRRSFMHPIYYREGVFVGYRGYEIEDRKPRYPFGYGLSYTSYEYSDIAVERVHCGAVMYKVYCTVKNVGDVDGEEIVQLYIGDDQASVARPIKELKGFERVALKAGEEKRVQFNITRKDLSFYDIYTKSWIAEPGMFTAYVGANSAETLKANFNLEK